MLCVCLVIYSEHQNPLTIEKTNNGSARAKLIKIGYSEYRRDSDVINIKVLIASL